MILNVNNNDFHHLGKFQICARACDYFRSSKPHSGRSCEPLFRRRRIVIINLQRGEQKSVSNIDQTRLNVQFLLPLNEIVTNFYDELKSITSGYASFDYEDAGYQQSSLVKLGEKVL